MAGVLFINPISPPKKVPFLFILQTQKILCHLVGRKKTLAKQGHLKINRSALKVPQDSFLFFDATDEHSSFSPHG